MTLHATRLQQSFKRDIFFPGDVKPSPQGDTIMVDSLDNLRQAVYHRMITEPGTLAHRPSYGVGLIRWKNSLGSLPRQQQLMIAIEGQFRSEPRISELTGLSVEENGEKSGEFLITLRYVPRGYSEISQEFTV